MIIKINARDTKYTQKIGIQNVFDRLRLGIHQQVCITLLCVLTFCVLFVTYPCYVYYVSSAHFLFQILCRKQY